MSQASSNKVVWVAVGHLPNSESRLFATTKRQPLCNLPISHGSLAHDKTSASQFIKPGIVLFPGLVIMSCHHQPLLIVCKSHIEDYSCLNQAVIKEKRPSVGRLPKIDGRNQKVGKRLECPKLNPPSTNWHCLLGIAERIYPNWKMGETQSIFM